MSATKSLQGVTVRDSAGHEAKITSDGGDWKLDLLSKIRNAAGSIISPATELTTAAIRTALEAVIGTAGTPATGVVSIQGVTSGRAVQVTTVASAADAIVTEFLKNGTSEDMVVDGSTTPVEFVFNADSTIDIRLAQLRIVFVADLISLGTDNFGRLGGALSNGILVEATINDGTAIAISTMMRNEDLLRLSSTDVVFAGNKDLIVGSVNFSGEELLVHGTSDNVKITIRDNLTLAQRAVWYLTATLYGSG